MMSLWSLYSGLGHSVGQGVANTTEGVTNRVLEALHRSDSAKAHEGGNESIFNQVLSRGISGKYKEELSHSINFS